MAANLHSQQQQQLLLPPPGFPPALIGRTLNVAEFFHQFQQQHQHQEEEPEAAEAPGRPFARRLFAALAARDDLDSYFYVGRHLTFLLRCLDRQELAEQPPDRDESEEGNDEAEDRARQRPKKRYLMELVRLALKPRQGSVGLEHATLETMDYHELDVQGRLALFEGLEARLLELLPGGSQKKEPPLARLSGGGLVWWFRCAPDCLLVETPAPVSTPTPANGASTSSAAAAALASTTWRCCVRSEDLEALRRTAQEPDRCRLNAVIDRVLLRAQPPASSSADIGGGGVGGGTVGNYLRARFTSRLIGWAELLHREMPPGGCMSPHRLRHYLTGSTRASELADCLLQFEGRLASALREQREASTKQWRDEVRKCGTVSRLNFLLDRLLLDNPSLARQIAGRRGVCDVCKRPVTAAGQSGQALLFCHGCCCGYHALCVSAPAAAAASTSAGAATAAAAASLVSRCLWLCKACQKNATPPPVPSATATTEAADNGGAWMTTMSRWMTLGLGRLAGRPDDAELTCTNNTNSAGADRFTEEVEAAGDRDSEPAEAETENEGESQREADAYEDTEADGAKAAGVEMVEAVEAVTEVAADAEVKAAETNGNTGQAAEVADNLSGGSSDSGSHQDSDDGPTPAKQPRSARVTDVVTNLWRL